MNLKRFQPYLTGAIIVLVLVALSFILPLVLDDAAGQTARFLTLFIAVLLTFVFFIVWVGRTLHRKVPRRLHALGEMILIFGILGGVVATFQPWSLDVYHIGFTVLLYSVLAFTVWSHVVPKGAQQREAEPGGVTPGEALPEA